jgi:secreted PhoX family phosphatase
VNVELSRRRLLALGGAATAAFVGRGPIRSQFEHLASALHDDSGYGPLGAPDSLGIRLPAGFSAELVGRTGDRIGPSQLEWHGAPDGGACFAVRRSSDHIYVSNAELDDGLGGVSAVRYDTAGSIVDAYPILEGTNLNCSGGATPWGTWLSCEEHDEGQVWECDPLGGPSAVAPALGTFRHEAVAVDSVRRQIFLTEDHPTGRLYRFQPANWPDLSIGELTAAHVAGSTVSWIPVSSGGPERSDATTAFDGGEGVVVDGDWLLFATKGDRRIWEMHLVSGRIGLFHDCVADPDTALTHVDNLALHPMTGHLFVAEDGGDLELCMLTRTGGHPIVTPVVRFEGHDGSEVAGPAFSPDGSVLYLSSQRGTDGRGMTVRIAGPWFRWITSIGGPAHVDARATRLGTVGS